MPRLLDSLKHGLNRCLEEAGMKFDMIRGKVFAQSNESFKGAILEIKKEGLELLKTFQKSQAKYIYWPIVCFPGIGA